MNSVWALPQGSTSQISGATVFLNPNPGNEASALITSSPVNFGGGYFEFSIDRVAEGGPWIGVTTPEHFKDGYGLRGLMFGGGAGNLANGGALVQSNWGPKFGAGDRAGVMITATITNIKVHFFKNGQPLGLAYDVNRYATFKNQQLPLHACVSSGSQTAITFIPNAAPPAGEDRIMPTLGGTVEGHWKLMQFENSPVTTEATISISFNSSSEVQINGKVANHFWGVSRLQNGQFVGDGPSASTMMLGSPEQMRLETGLQSLFKNAPYVQVDFTPTGRVLTLRTADGRVASFCDAAERPSTIHNVDM